MLFIRRLICSLALLALSFSATAATNSSYDCLLTWAEKTYSNLFISPSASTTYANYYYRQYSGNAYLAIDTNSQHFVYVGPASGNSLLDLGAASGWFTQAGCAAPTVTASFYDFNYLQNLNGQPVATGTIVDKGANVASTVTFGANGTTAPFIPQANGSGYSWGSPISYGNGFGSNPDDTNLPAVAAACQYVANQGGPRGKTTDVLVTKSATAIVSATALANLKFTVYYEDCAPTSGESLSFDGSGNLTAVSSDGNKTLTAGEVTSALTGNAVGNPGNGGYLTFNAYSYTDSQSGQKRYVIVEHGSDKTSSLSKGYLGVWLISN